jgi:hypothetical protein
VRKQRQVFIAIEQQRQSELPEVVSSLLGVPAPR